ncbi:hypothetical protein KCU77_g6886, partial [Aureobasidium melanogenum]
MSFSAPYIIAPVVYEFVWTVDSTPKQTSTYTTTYFGPPGSHTAYAQIVNTALPSPSQIETIGIPYTILPGEVSTQHASATVATHMPTRPIVQTDHALVTPATDQSDQTSASREMPCHQVLSGRMLSLRESYLICLQVVLVCLFCGGYLWSRCLRRRSQSHRREGGILSFEKSAVYELA